MKFALGDLESLVRAVEFLQLDALVGEGLGRADAGERGFDLGIDGRSALFDILGHRAHFSAAQHQNQNQNRQDDDHDQCQTPFDREHDYECARDGQKRNDQILRAVVSKLRDLKKVAGQAAHELAGAVAVIKVITEALHMAEQVAPDVGLDADAEGVAPVGDDVIKPGAQQIGHGQDPHDREEQAVGVLRQQALHRAARDDREGQIDRRDDHGAEHIQQEQPTVRLEIGDENAKQAMLPVKLCVHCFDPLRYCVSNSPV